MYQQALGELPAGLQAVFRSEETANLDHLSAQSLFLLSWLFISELTPRGGATTPEINVPDDSIEGDSLGNPQDWYGIYWPLDLWGPSNPEPDLPEPFEVDDLIPFINGQASPRLSLELDDHDDEDRSSFFRVYVPFGSQEEILLGRISKSPKLRSALISSAEATNSDWAAERAALCLRSLEKEWEDQTGNSDELGRQEDLSACNKCGSPVTNQAKFCHECGSEVFDNGAKFCSQCGSKRGDGATFCGECGKRF